MTLTELRIDGWPFFVKAAPTSAGTRTPSQPAASPVPSPCVAGGAPQQEES